MDLFLPTFYQMLVLLLLIGLGFLLAKVKFVNTSAATVLAKLENAVFIPALILNTFIKNFSIEKLQSFWKILLFSFVLEIFAIFLALFLGRFASKSKYIRNITAYGLAFANFSFMGNAVVEAVFPNVFTEYIIFTLPLWSLIYLWGAPTLLIPNENEKSSLKSRLKSLINPMFISIFIGIALGLGSSYFTLPVFITSPIQSCASCMSPIAMILTGISLSNISFKNTIKEKSIYIASVLRLLVVPLIFIGLFAITGLVNVFDKSFIICAICSMAMPLGLNAIVIPAAYGKDTTAASGMILVSHILSLITIPFIFYLLNLLIGA